MVTVSAASRFRPVIYYKQTRSDIGLHPSSNEPVIRVIEGANFMYKFLPGWGSGPLDICRRIAEIWRGGYDVIYGFEYHPNVSWPVYLTNRLKPYRFFSDWCDWFAGGSNRLRGWKIAHKVDGFLEERIRFLAEKVTVTSKVLWERAASIGVSEQKIIHIPEGAATDYIRPLPQEEMRQKFGFPQDVPIVAAVNDGDMRKVVEIFARVLRHIPSSRLLVIGRQRPEVVEAVQRLNIGEHVYLAGWVSDEDYPRYLACADLCFLPLQDNLSNKARWPAKVLDFLSAGKATVVNGVGEVLTLFIQHDVGLLAGDSEDEMSDSIVNLLKDEEMRRYYGSNARRLMVEEWDWRIRGDQIEQVVVG